jgi:hypothetical protein
VVDPLHVLDFCPENDGAAADMDAMMFYDHFTPLCPINLETYGSVPGGEAKDFVDGDDNIRFEDMLPANTHGGNHSEAYIRGLTYMQEAVRLIRGMPSPNRRARPSAGRCRAAASPS